MNGTDVRAGYDNIDGFPDLPNNQEFSDEKIKGDVLNLDWHTEDDTCDEIVAIHVLNTCFLGQIGRVLSNWVKKLKKGGTLTIGSTDLKEIAKNIQYDVLPFEESVMRMFGQQKVGIWDLHKNSFTVPILRNMLEQNGLTVTKTRLSNYSIVMEAVKGYVPNNV